MITDEELYRRVLGGDEGALEALVHRYHAPLLGFLYRFTADRHLAEDLLQESFTRLVTYRGELPRRFKAWAFTIASNLARDHFRSAARRRELPSAFESEEGEPRFDVLADDDPGPDELLLRKDERRVVVEAMQMLPPPQREVLVLRFYHGLTLEEVADVTGAPLGTVKSRMFLAARRMKEYLSQEGGSVHAETISESQRRARR